MSLVNESEEGWKSSNERRRRRESRTNDDSATLIEGRLQKETGRGREMSTVRLCARRQRMSPSIVPSPSAPHPIRRRSHDAASMDVVEPDRISNFECANFRVITAINTTTPLYNPLDAKILHLSLSSYVVPGAGMRQVLVKGDRSSLSIP